ncbi:hypothetical protein BKA81DRAFT_123330 [Phyllosticta paracitricarpa]
MSAQIQIQPLAHLTLTQHQRAHSLARPLTTRFVFFCWLLSSCLSDLLGGNRMLQSPMLLARRRSLLHTSRSESTSLPIRLLRKKVGSGKSNVLHAALKTIFLGGHSRGRPSWELKIYRRKRNERSSS